MSILIVANLTATSAMFGVIWIVQLVHYPMFEGLDETSFTQWHSFHSRQITFIVAPLMVSELILSGWLALRFTSGLSLSAFVFTLGVWLTTFIWSVPLHDFLHRSRQADRVTALAAIQKLVKTNWARTFLYTVKMCALIFLYLQNSVQMGIDR